MPRTRRRNPKGENPEIQKPEPQSQIQEEGRTKTMVTTATKFRDMTDAQKQAAFEKFSERQDTNKGRNVAKRKALTDLKAAHIDEYNASVTKYALVEGVTMPSGPDSSDESEE